MSWTWSRLPTSWERHGYKRFWCNFWWTTIRRCWKCWHWSFFWDALRELVQGKLRFVTCFFLCAIGPRLVVKIELFFCLICMHCLLAEKWKLAFLAFSSVVLDHLPASFVLILLFLLPGWRSPCCFGSLSLSAGMLDVPQRI